MRAFKLPKDFENVYKINQTKLLYYYDDLPSFAVHIFNAFPLLQRREDRVMHFTRCLPQKNTKSQLLFASKFVFLHTIQIAPTIFLL